ncbi:MAG: phage/plasmid replication protein, II/X family [Candidatus Accumulibacter sp.]|nr:phage/plasmid replication protein, II/X family [Accumulibacter sp.]
MKQNSLFVKQKNQYLIDWLTLRIPLKISLGKVLFSRIKACLNTLHCCNSSGELLWKKLSLDVDALRSDTRGLCWQVQSDGKIEYLVIGASPASLEYGLNVFGSCDLQHCSRVLIKHAGKALQSILPDFDLWQCRRIDITGNFVLPDAASVKQALRQLSLSDGGRRRATTTHKGGDSVYWNPASDLVKGKAYHKGPQMAVMQRKGVVDITDEQLILGNRLLRLEFTLAARWFRRFSETKRNWYELTTFELENLYVNFFEKVIGVVEVKDMNRTELVLKIAQINSITEGRAMAAFTTYRNIRQDGFEVVRAYMSRSTWQRHLKYLRAVGISDSYLQQSNVVQYPVHIILAKPVRCWEDIRRAA